MAFVDLLGFTGETLEVNIIAVITLSYFIAFAKSLISLPLGKNKKNRRKCNGFKPSLLAAIFGWMRYFGSGVFQLLKFIMPGASFAEIFDVSVWFLVN